VSPPRDNAGFGGTAQAGLSCDPPVFDAIPVGLTGLARWVPWRLLPDEKDPTKTKKVPIGPNGHPATPLDPANWASFETIQRVFRTGNYSGVGIALGAVSIEGRLYHLVGFDIDSCLDENGELLDWARPIGFWLKSTYAEISPSRTGIKTFALIHDEHIATVRTEFGFGAGTGRRAFHADVEHTAVHAPGVEFYVADRFFTVTGWQWPGSPHGVALTNLTEMRAVLNAMPKGKKPEKGGKKKDNSGSAKADRLARRLVQGKVVTTLMELHAALLADDDPEIVIWAEVKGDPATKEGLRELERIFNRATKSKGATEKELADAFAEQYKDELRYVAAWKSWVYLDDTRWVRDDTQRALMLASDLCRDAAQGQDPSVRTRLERTATTDAVARAASRYGELAVRAEIFDANIWVLNTPDGVVDLKTGEMRGARPDDYLMKCAAVSPSEGEDCPKWFSFLERALAGDGDLQAYLRRLIGYCLTGDISEQAFFYFYGMGRNGRSTFLDTARWMMGDYGDVAEAETFLATHSQRHTQEIARLKGARMVISDELEEGRTWNGARVKQVTGGGTLIARMLHENDVEYMPQFKPLFSGNHKPAFKSIDPAIRDRTNLIPFTVYIPPEERNPNLKEELQAEGPGILRWAINGCLEWQKTRLRPPAAVIGATEEYLSQEDDFAQWVKQNCIIAGQDYEEDKDLSVMAREANQTRLKNNEVSLAELFLDWKNWTEHATHKQPGGVNPFSDKLQSLLKSRFENTTTHRMAFKGIALRHQRRE
jgi:putative DNA primase/helicase